ncbi:hypothetical protein L085_18910 [Serratia sp. FS14]|nr:hypothetical protein L085_18910 [Serratia sp. FS14]
MPTSVRITSAGFFALRRALQQIRLPVVDLNRVGARGDQVAHHPFDIFQPD